MEIIEIKMMRGSCIIYFYSRTEFLFFIFRVFGGILGWDPVRTTCIPDEMMMML